MGEDGEIHQHSGWLIPLAVAAAILILCGALLLYYMRPFALTRTGTAPFRDSRDSGAPTSVTVGSAAFTIPRRYLEPGPRGAGDSVALVAALPDMRGFREEDAALFAGNAPDSPLVHLLIRAGDDGLEAAQRLNRLYMPYIVDPKGGKGPFGLAQYVFRAGSGYSGDELYADPARTRLFLCEQPAQDLPAPNCLAIDRPIASGVTVSYRFKRAQLASWRAIDQGVDRLVAKFIRR